MSQPIDWSQVELRILAKMLAEEPSPFVFPKRNPPRVVPLVVEMVLGEPQEPQERPRDVHEAIAMQMFGRPRSGLTEDEERLRRSAAFGMLYGMDPMKARRHFAMTEGFRRAYGGKDIE